MPDWIHWDMGRGEQDESEQTVAERGLLPFQKPKQVAHIHPYWQTHITYTYRV